MFFSKPIQWYHSHADKIWLDGTFKGAQVWDFDILDFNDFFIMKSL